MEAELTALLQAAGGTLPVIKKNERGVYVMVETEAGGHGHAPAAAKPAAPAQRPKRLHPQRRNPRRQNLQQRHRQRRHQQRLRPLPPRNQLNTSRWDRIRIASYSSVRLMRV